MAVFVVFGVAQDYAQALYWYRVFNAVGAAGAVKFHVEAAKYGAEAARLREQLATLEG